MPDSLQDALTGLAAIVGKQLLDPHGLINPGKMFNAGAA